MPSKIQLDENLYFLYTCLQKSDMKFIDFHAVGAATSLKAPAARMRYTRLRRQIESGTVAGAHGHSPAAEETETKPIRKRKRKDCDADDINTKKKEDARRKETERETADEADAEASNSSESDSESNMPLSKLVALKHNSAYASPYPLVPSWTQVPQGGVWGNRGHATLPIRGGTPGSPTSYHGHATQSGASAGNVTRLIHPIPGLRGMGDQSPNYRFAHPSTSLNAFGRPFAPGAWGVPMSPPPNPNE
ncbi:uncharacterized protein BP5553_10234 [Venustampulla echinocandica]|uniref:Myb-like DNA-binding domain-containing protein n=1 Tax=Venustampulla echinocandica TaxID=2656787 RepID=A0A370T9N2_9HELO|nr:uncharacterized protein BP5553_10234 [Venustampulla echinocandica]RDL30356.1 hypothetical protein BP5553_10234 [Venustampulla echinocandica]